MSEISFKSSFDHDTTEVDRGGCSTFDQDNIFRRFQVLEFPICFVGLSSSMELDVEVNLNNDAYLKTICDGNLMKFEEARNYSAAHRAYEIVQKGDHILKITFKPTTECISKAKRNKQFDNRFVFDLRLIKIYGSRCCNDELHSEIGRYYISGQYEYCSIINVPNIVNFGEVKINDTEKKYVKIRNESSLISAKIQYIRVTGFEVTPATLTVHPRSSHRICISIKPTSFQIANILHFKIRNPHDLFDSFNTLTRKEPMPEDVNFLTYTMRTDAKIIYNKTPKIVLIESLHKLNEKSAAYTYMDEELVEYKKKTEKAHKFLEFCKSSHTKKVVVEKVFSKRDQCYSEHSLKPQRPAKFFCKPIRKRMTPYDLLQVTINPFFVDFGRIGLSTYGNENISIENKTKYEISISILKDACVLYTDEKLKTMSFKMKPYSEFTLKIYCLGFVEGTYSGTFEYIIDDKFNMKHPYCLQVGTPTLCIQEKNLKFGMVTAESFITSVAVKLENHFNIPVQFDWDEVHSDTPFEIIPASGCVPEHSCRICDVTYVCKLTKTKAHEIDCISDKRKIIPMELNVMTRKISIKFLQAAVFFKDIPLNLEVKEKVKLENSSREIALFHVVEPLIPGLTIEPMIGSIGPKMVITFEIKVKISCTLEFAFDICVKINNKENVFLPISGNVIEPRILIQPKNIYMSRVPCYMVTYVPVVIQNLSGLKSTIEVIDLNDENIFDVFVAVGNEKVKVSNFVIEGGQSKTVFIKVYDVFRREFEMFVPFRINELLGPPTEASWSSELHYYTGDFEKLYENNPRVKLKVVNKDISYCRISGVITVPWIDISENQFDIEYSPIEKNVIDFTMANVSKYPFLPVTIMTAKLSPNFTLTIIPDGIETVITDNSIKFDLERGMKVSFTLKFHPRGHGRFVSTAFLYLDKFLGIAYSNLTFFGKRQVPVMTPSCNRIICAPCPVNTEIRRTMEVILEAEAHLNTFSYVSSDEPNLQIEFKEAEILENGHTVLTVEFKISCAKVYSRKLSVSFHNDNGANCDIEISFSFSYCPLTLHNISLVNTHENPYPYYPLPNQNGLYEYMETSLKFLEKWMYQQGFRRDLYPIIPETFHIISSALTSQGGTKTKGINCSYLNFMRRIAGPLMKHLRKISITGAEEPFKSVKEIHDNYKDIINLLRSRGVDFWVLQAKFLLSYDQFVVYSDNVTPKSNAHIILTQELLADENLFKRLNKQSWMDFILHTYKVFVIDSCFFDCVCLKTEPRDIIFILTDWYNSLTMAQHHQLRGSERSVKVVKNITTDLSDGIAIISAILNFCPFLKEHFSVYSEADANDEGTIIHNACLIIEAMNVLRLYFPLTSKDMLQPNFIQMLFLSVHLYVVLPMFKPKDVVIFNPPLLKSSTRMLSICPASQESLIFTFQLINNSSNSFVVEKAPSGENGKKMFLSVKFTANLVSEEKAILLVHGYNKTRIFDTYIVFKLSGVAGSLIPWKKCKVTGPLYRPNKVDVLVSSPFQVPATFRLSITDIEPDVPVDFPNIKKPIFYLRRLNLIEKEIYLNAAPKETNQQETTDQKLFLQLTCLNTQLGNSWIWFRSDIGEFFIRVTTQPRWDLALDTLQAKVFNWPMDPCTCGEACECYRTTSLTIPHKNELMVKSLRYSLSEHASETMMQVFDRLIESMTGKIILRMLFAEGGTNMSEISHILSHEVAYRISSKSMTLRIEKITLAHHTGAMFNLPVTLPANDKCEKHSIIFTSECGMDVRTYKVLFVEIGNESG